MRSCLSKSRDGQSANFTVLFVVSALLSICFVTFSTSRCHLSCELSKKLLDLDLKNPDESTNSVALSGRQCLTICHPAKPTVFICVYFSNVLKSFESKTWTARFHQTRNLISRPGTIQLFAQWPREEAEESSEISSQRENGHCRRAILLILSRF